jgi:hypothetical protein
MADEPGTLEQLAQQFGLALAPLEVLLAPENFSTLLVELGLDTPPALQADAAFLQKLSDTVAKAAALGPELESVALAVDSGTDDDLISAVKQLLETILELASALDALATDFKRAAAGLMDASALEAFVEEMVERIFENVLVRYLESNYPRLWQVLALMTIVEYTSFDILTDDGPVTVLRRRLYFDRIGAFLSNPIDLLQTGYGWGTEQFDGKALFSQFADAFEAFQQLDDYTEVTDDGTASFDLFALTVGPTSNIHPPGLQAKLWVDLPSTTDLTLVQISDNLRVAFQFSSALAGGLILRLLPPARVELDADATVKGNAALGLVGQAADPNSSFILVGQTAGSSLQATKVQAGLVGTFQWDAATNNVSADAGFQAMFVKGKLTIDLSSADGFVTSVSPQNSFQAAFDLTLGWSTLRGFYIAGGASAEMVLPLHISLGPVALELLYVDLGITPAGLSVTASLAASVSLGPISATIDRLGLTSNLAFQRGNLGPLDFGISFKPPNGLGIAIDAGLVTGGGYISFDPNKGQYAGILQLSLVDTIGITVIGVLDTIMPDGSSGYSFLLIITFTLPPIQLGFGFTLNRVGGLGGVNRTMNTDALQAGFRAHTLGAIMFPPDPIDNAPQIVSDIRNFFPVATGRYLFGPLLELGWGTPTQITLTVGVLLEVPDPIRMVILGLIDAGVPTEDDALLQLHIEVLGIIDFGAKTLAIDGTLFDSSILIYALVGDLALRVSWGSNPNFLFSLGGFNPNFNTDGLDVPKLARLSVSLGKGSNPRISADSYFAVTSNSVQFGADVQAYAAAGGFSIRGYLGFDVLIIISPFSFEFDFSASFDVAYDGQTLLGLNVNGTFQGPTPWHFHGEASISLLFFSVSASVDLTWGSSTKAIIPSQPVLPDLIKAFQNPQSWSAALPPATTVGVSLATKKPTDLTLCVHPIGTLQVKETVVPLDLPIAKYGNSTPSDGTEFSIQSVQINSQTETIQTIEDYFAPGQFLNLSDADKLSKPSFEEMDAGVNIGSSAILNGQDSPRTVVYQEFYIYDPNDVSSPSGIYLLPAHIHLSLCAQGAGFASLVKNTGLQKYSKGPTTPAVVVEEPQYVVTSVVDLSIRSDVLGGSGGTYFQAQAALSAYLAANPGENVNLQIMPLHEVAA